jgi:hypothetical protein
MSDPLEPLVLPAGTTIHVQGFPFVVARDTPVHGRSGNLKLALTSRAEKPPFVLTDEEEKALDRALLRFKKD